MRNIVLDNSFQFSTEPFPAFRGELVFGRNKRDRSFITSKVEPIKHFTIDEHFTTTSKNEAEVYAQNNNLPLYSISEHMLLPENKFRVIKTREKGTIMIVPGEDTSNRALVFVGCEGGFRGGVSFIQNEKEKQANILKSMSAQNACSSKIAVMAIFEENSTLAFHSYGRRTNDVFQCTYINSILKVKRFTKSEWDVKHQPEDEVDVL
jgi:hypothetical protein